jgi:hypothetical protein
MFKNQTFERNGICSIVNKNYMLDNGGCVNFYLALLGMSRSDFEKNNIRIVDSI